MVIEVMICSLRFSDVAKLKYSLQMRFPLVENEQYLAKGKTAI